MDVPTRPNKARVSVSIGRLAPLAARAAAGAILGAVVGTAASVAVGYALYIAMLLRVWNRPVGIDSWFAGMAALPLIGWSFGALPGALTGAAILSSRKPIAALAGCGASLAYAAIEGLRGDPYLGGLIAAITSLGAAITGGSLYLGMWLLRATPTKRKKAA
jgi:hypothetical protein